MKKLLSILAAVGLTATSATSVVACDSGKKDPTPPPTVKINLSTLGIKTTGRGFNNQTVEKAFAAMTEGSTVDLKEITYSDWKAATHDADGSFKIVPVENSKKYTGEVDVTLAKLTDDEFIITETNKADHYMFQLHNPLTPVKVKDLENQINSPLSNLNEHDTSVYFMQNDMWDYKARNVWKNENFHLNSLYNIDKGRDLLDNDLLNAGSVIKVRINYNYGDEVQEEQSTNLFIKIVVETPSTTRSKSLKAIQDALPNFSTIKKEDWQQLWVNYSTEILNDIGNKSIMFDIPEKYAEIDNKEDNIMIAWRNQKFARIIIQEITFNFLHDLSSANIDKGFKADGFNLKINSIQNINPDPSNNSFNVTGTSSFKLTLVEKDPKPEDFWTVNLPITAQIAYYNPL